MSLQVKQRIWMKMRARQFKNISMPRTQRRLFFYVALRKPLILSLIAIDATVLKLGMKLSFPKWSITPIAPWQMVAEMIGAVIRFIPTTDMGELDMLAYTKILGPKTKIV